MTIFTNCQNIFHFSVIYLLSDQAESIPAFCNVHQQLLNHHYTHRAQTGIQPPRAASVSLNFLCTTSRLFPLRYLSLQQHTSLSTPPPSTSSPPSSLPDEVACRPAENVIAMQSASPRTLNIDSGGGWWCCALLRRHRRADREKCFLPHQMMEEKVSPSEEVWEHLLGRVSAS